MSRPLLKHQTFVFENLSLNSLPSIRKQNYFAGLPLKLVSSPILMELIYLGDL